MSNEDDRGRQSGRCTIWVSSLAVVLLMISSIISMIPTAASPSEGPEGRGQVAPVMGGQVWADPIPPDQSPFENSTYPHPAPQQQRPPSCAEHMMVLVEEGLYGEPGVEEKVMRYAEDVELTGLGVAVYTCGQSSPVLVRDFLTARSGLVGAFFIGDIPEAWFEMDCQWDIYEPLVHCEFPCDLFFMDLDGSWTDRDGDGTYDVHDDGTGDMGTEIWFGRLVADQTDRSEADLVCNYLDKNHDYREGDTTYNQNGLVYVDNDWSPSNSEYYEVDAIMDHTDHVYDPVGTDRADYLSMLDANPYNIVHLKCHGSSTDHIFLVPDNDSTAWEAEGVTSNTVFDEDPEVLLYNLFICSGTRYTTTDNIGCAYILTDTHGLAAVGSTKTGSMYNTVHFYEPLGDGHRLGDAFTDWFDTMAELDRKWFYGMTVLGDPTLRVTGEHNVTISTPGLDSATGVVHYRQGGIWKAGDISSGQWTGTCDHSTQVYIDSVVNTYTTTDETSFWVVEPMVLEVQYYQQHQVDLSTSGLPEGEVAEVTYRQNGVERTLPLNDSHPFSELCDHGSTLSVEDEVTVTADQERYHTTDAHQLTVTGALTATLDYIHQYKVKVEVTTVGTTALAPGNTVEMQYRQDGTKKSTYLYDGLNMTLWMDEGTKYSFAQRSSGSDATHRWATGMTRTDDVTSSITSTMVYHEQWYCMMGSTGGLLTATYHGTVDTVRYGLASEGTYYDSSDWVGWCDDLTTMSGSEIVPGPPCERYHTSSPIITEVSMARAVSLPYHHELKVTIAAEGLVTPATATATVATANPSPSDDVSGGDIHSYVITLEDTSSYTWTNWVHANASMKALTSMDMKDDRIYVMFCWTEEGVRHCRPTIAADMPCGAYVVHYVGLRRTISAEDGFLPDDVLVTLEVGVPDCLSEDGMMVLTERLPDEFSIVMGSAMVDGTQSDPTMVSDPPRQVLKFELDAGSHVITFHMSVDRDNATEIAITNDHGSDPELKGPVDLELYARDALVAHTSVEDLPTEVLLLTCTERVFSSS